MKRKIIFSLMIALFLSACGGGSSVASNIAPAVGIGTPSQVSVVTAN